MAVSVHQVNIIDVWSIPTTHAQEKKELQLQDYNVVFYWMDTL